jgi:hypothetical protein
MQYLQINTTGQQLLFTLKEGLLLLGESYSHYLLKLTHDATGTIYRCIPSVILDDARLTTLSIDTDTDDAVNGAILMTNPGRYSYEVYAQNSSTNLDESLSIGIIEKGWITAQDNQIYFTDPTIEIPQDKVYNG